MDLARLRLPLALSAALLLAGCGQLGEVFDGPAPRPTVTSLEVFNRTEEAVVLIDRDGRQLEVPACGSAAAAAFTLDQVEVRTAIGYAYSFGAPAADPVSPGPHFLVVDRNAFGAPEPVRPVALPRCEGRLPSQPGA